MPLWVCRDLWLDYRNDVVNDNHVIEDEFTSIVDNEFS
jgi:hypothetical protein